MAVVSVRTEKVAQQVAVGARITRSAQDCSGVIPWCETGSKEKPRNKQGVASVLGARERPAPEMGTGSKSLLD